MIPLFTNENPGAVPGIKYFFPENPAIDKVDILGMEAHMVTRANLALGDIKDVINPIISQDAARNVYLCLYNNNNEEIYYNLPLRSLFTYAQFAGQNTLSKRIKPITCKLKTRSCYAYLPANLPVGPNFQNVFISITFYYN